MSGAPNELGPGFRVRLVAHADEAARVAADLVERLLTDLAAPRLGLATGRSVLPLYAELRRRAARGLSFTGATTLNLDEYVGLDASDPRGFRAWMRRELFDHVDLDPARAHVPRCVAPGPAQGREAAAEASRYGALARALGPCDLQVLGIGRNGHIGFNEPGAPRASRCRVVELAATTRADAAATFGEADAAPRQALTLGLDEILSARRVVLFAFGDSKSEALARAVSGPVSDACPASWLREHPDALVLCDPAAAAGLPRGRAEGAGAGDAWGDRAQSYNR